MISIALVMDPRLLKGASLEADMEEISRDTVPDRFFVWASFLVAAAVLVAGILVLEGAR